MTGSDRPTPQSPPEDQITPARSGGPAWSQQWQQVPEQWRTLCYRIDTAPADAVFLHNPRYLRNPDGHDFTPAVVPQRFCQETGVVGVAVRALRASARSSRRC